MTYQTDAYLAEQRLRASRPAPTYRVSRREVSNVGRRAVALEIVRRAGAEGVTSAELAPMLRLSRTQARIHLVWLLEREQVVLAPFVRHTVPLHPQHVYVVPEAVDGE